jgi:heterodisulfide reductase subunit C
MKWLLGIDEMKKNIGKKSGKEQAQILNATMEETDKLIHNMKTKRVKYLRKGRKL